MNVIPEFDLTTAVNNGTAVVFLRGELDISTAPLLKESVVGLVERGARQVTVDFSELEFIDSNGLHALVVSLKRLKEHDGELRLKSPRPNARKVLEMVGLTEIIPIV